MRIGSYAFLLTGLLSSALVCSDATLVPDFLARQTPETSLLTLVIAIALFIIWLLVLMQEINIDEAQAELTIGAQRGREAGAASGQMSIDPEARISAIEDRAQAGDQRKSVRWRVFTANIVPYLLLIAAGLALSAFGLFI